VSQEKGPFQTIEHATRGNQSKAYGVRLHLSRFFEGEGPQFIGAGRNASEKEGDSLHRKEILPTVEQQQIDAGIIDAIDIDKGKKVENKCD